MKQSNPLPLTLLILSTLLIPPTTPWTLTYRNNSTTNATIIHQTAPQPCTPIHHQKGYEFSFDPEGSWCLDFWDEATCETRIGWSCDGLVWRKVASRDIGGFDVYGMPGASTSVGVGMSGSAGMGMGSYPRKMQMDLLDRGTMARSLWLVRSLIWRNYPVKG
ncbi:hypothetical protein BO78DRAFT_422140 [Aspergillus sclerotiicarbonarius CBS 121057]|uniref:Uncharacterized protein n=1 Tax=Aspergillus sclerotiicarbonarius (strain CBS 121057 / IBT 28362) TaxID=1448318 RepID=A0A319DYF7_ASPSB|nr:hypothetical protein BO78DRAFT_422140 [Aspergillus sclerotiicarbonarius CBS 121057]